MNVNKREGLGFYNGLKQVYVKHDIGRSLLNPF